MRTAPLDVPVIFEVSKFRPFFRAPETILPFKFSGIVRNYNEKSVQVDVLAAERMLWDMRQIWIDWDFVKVLDVLQTKQLPLLVGWKHTTPLLERMLKEGTT
jgi:hypothetical protein